MKHPRIGLRFYHPDDKHNEGVILQSCMYLPKIRNNNKKGPWFGVHFEESEYTWYHIEDIIKLL